MNGKERILSALEVREPDRVPLYIHGINEESIVSIGRRITDGLPDPKQFYDMKETERVKLLDALFLIHEEFGVDGFTSFEIPSGPYARRSTRSAGPMRSRAQCLVSFAPAHRP